MDETALALTTLSLLGLKKLPSLIKHVNIHFTCFRERRTLLRVKETDDVHNAEKMVAVSIDASFAIAPGEAVGRQGLPKSRRVS